MTCQEAVFTQVFRSLSKRLGILQGRQLVTQPGSRTVVGTSREKGVLLDSTAKKPGREVARQTGNRTDYDIQRHTSQAGLKLTVLPVLPRMTFNPDPPSCISQGMRLLEEVLYPRINCIYSCGHLGLHKRRELQQAMKATDAEMGSLGMAV